MWGSLALLKMFRGVQIEKDLEVTASFKSLPLQQVSLVEQQRVRSTPTPELEHMPAEAAVMPEEDQLQLWSLGAAWQADFTFLGHTYTYSDKLSLSSPAFSSVSLPSPTELHSW